MVRDRNPGLCSCLTLEIRQLGWGWGMDCVWPRRSYIPPSPAYWVMCWPEWDKYQILLTESQEWEAVSVNLTCVLQSRDVLCPVWSQLCLLGLQARTRKSVHRAFTSVGTLFLAANLAFDYRQPEGVYWLTGDKRAWNNRVLGREKTLLGFRFSPHQRLGTPISLCSFLIFSFPCQWLPTALGLHLRNMR